MSKFDVAVVAVVGALRPGQVVSYGWVARQAGYPQASRMVAGALQRAVNDVPWWRVVNRLGILSIRHPHITAEDQAELLRKEEVGVREEDGVLKVELS
jgi:methylated-DNA-protein-cysteine methyltransferase related protein